MKTWLNVPADHDFSIYNLPFGIYSMEGVAPRAGIAIGDYVVDLQRCQNMGMFSDLLAPTMNVFKRKTLNRFIRKGKEITSGVRKIIQDELCKEDSFLRDETLSLLTPRDQVKMHLPVRVGDYTDFYSSREHATNVGAMFRDPDNALLPNWLHIPVGYHGRASSIIPSGKSIRRPQGQTMPKDAEQPVFGPSKRLDFELEVACVIGKNSKLGTSVSTEDAEDYIFGLVLFNDWSARDIQKWEYVPLGPFLGKNFASSISPWIVPLEALEHLKVGGYDQKDPEPLPYLKYEGDKNYDIELEVAIKTEDGSETTISRSNYKHLYWTMVQQLAHHTVNGCNLRVGDMLASGTISAPDESGYGSMLELSWAGSKEIPLSNGETRKFIEDGDTVIMRGFGNKDGKRVGFGEVRTKVLPSK
ncbi:fumarylacetoacetase [Lewinellaceae bacterium SD302]|nr:fumarylacetoacetase [Lewinellaceae bacterium SD302]